MATLILADTYAGWKGSLSADELRARVEGVRQMLAAPAETLDPTFPGLLAGAPPAQYAPLLADIAADVRRDTVRIQLGLITEADQRDVLATIAVPTLLIWGEQDARLRPAGGWGAAGPWRLVALRSPPPPLTAPWRVRSPAPAVDGRHERACLLDRGAPMSQPPVADGWGGRGASTAPGDSG